MEDKMDCPQCGEEIESLRRVNHYGRFIKKSVC